MNEETPVGVCPEHGTVYGEDVEYEFPNPAECGKEGCNEQLNRCTIAARAEVERHVEQ